MTIKIVVSIILGIVAVLLVAAVLIYVIGMRLPVNHTVSVAGVVAGSPDKVFALITNLPAQHRWRRGLEATDVLPSDAGRDHWVEHIGHGETMTFLATRTQAPTLREVTVQIPGDAYGGTWTYSLVPNGTAETSVTITENGFIHPPIYRFMMAHVFGPTYNLDRYLADLTKQAAKS